MSKIEFNILGHACRFMRAKDNLYNMKHSTIFSFSTENVGNGKAYRKEICMKTLETERLILREWQESDAPDMFKLGKSPNVVNAGWKIHKNIDESLECIRMSIKYQESWAIVLKENSKPIGWISLSDINRHDSYREMEYVISEDYQNKGYATEAVKCVLKYAFSELDLMIVAVCHYPFNIRSKRVIEKCGFTYEGTLRKYSRNLNDSVRYSMMKEEWESLYRK